MGRGNNNIAIKIILMAPIILNLLHTIERADRLQSFMEQMNQQTIPFKVWHGFTDNLPFKAISRSHKQIVEYAKNSNLPSITIAENDILFTSPKSWATYLKQMPEDFDLYLGSISGGNVDEKTKTADQWSGLILYTVHQRFYDAFLAADEMKNIDRWLSGLGLEEIEKLLGRKPVYKVCYPLPAICIDGLSGNSGKMVEHENCFAAYRLLK